MVTQPVTDAPDANVINLNDPDDPASQAPATSGTEAEEANNPPLNGQPTSSGKAASVSKPRKRAKKAAAKKAAKSSPRRAKSAATAQQAKFPRHPVHRALRIPGLILDQNAGHPATPTEAASFSGGSLSGPFSLELSSAKKYGFLETQPGGKVFPSERAKRALRPQTDTDELSALREAVLAAPDLGDVYNHYRGEYLPDDKFFTNALVETFGIPSDKVAEFKDVFRESLREAHLIDEAGERVKLIDIGREEGARPTKIASGSSRRSAADPQVDGACFVMQPFADPWGGYYETLFRPAIEQAGLRPVRADADIFGSGKIMDQVWRGIRAAKVLVAELTSRNPNVFYELGLAHALGKPVVLVAAEEQDVPFDLHHIRVIYYDKNDPFWGQKLIDKIADNVRSALANPEEAIFKVDETS